MDKAAFMKGLKEYVDRQMDQRHFSFHLNSSSSVAEPTGYALEVQELV